MSHLKLSAIKNKTEANVTLDNILKNNDYKAQNFSMTNKKFILPKYKDSETSGEDNNKDYSQNEGDSHDENDDYDNGNKNGKEKESSDPENKQYKYVCKNESHKKVVSFRTKTEKQLHIWQQHLCPYKGCSFSDEMNKIIAKHYAEKHKESKSLCKVCDKMFPNLENHMLIHPKCDLCGNRFLDNTTLYQHMKKCVDIKEVKEKDQNEISMVAQNKNVSLNIDTGNTEKKFSQFLIKLLESSGLNASEIKEGSEIFSLYANEQLLHKKSLRSEAYKSVQETSLLFDMPVFCDKETSKENLTRAGQLLSVRPEEKFSADTRKATINAIINFEFIENITIKINRVVSLCSLKEIQSKIFFQNYLSENCLDEVSGYCQMPFLEISYYKILLSLQILYCPLRVDILEANVMSYTRDESESFMSFADKIRRHLSICSRRLPETERVQYQERHVVRLLKRNLPSDLLKKLLEKEHMYSPFSSQEILNYYITHTQKLTANVGQYQVFSVKSQVRTKNFKQGTKKKTQNVHSIDQNEGQKFDQKYNGQQGKSKYNQNSSSQNYSKMSFQDKIKMAKEYTKSELACLKCLEPHLNKDCNKYFCSVTDKPHFYYKDNKRHLCGWHPYSLCKNINNNSAFRRQNIHKK